MLRQLYISNFALIDELSITFHPGFSVVTGETGAGKSVIIGAIGLLLGQRPDAKMFLPGGKKKCIIEAHFDVRHLDVQPFFEENDLDFEPDDCLLRREVSATGKSRAFINDTPVSLAAMKELGDRLVDIHSQHQNLLLGREDFQLQVVDMMAGNHALRQSYEDLYQEYTSAVATLRKLKENIEAAKREEDFLRFQAQELDELHLRDGEQAELEEASETMGHAEEIKSALYESFQAYDDEEGGILTKLRRMSAALHQIENVYRPIAEIAARVEDSYIEAKDIAQELSGHIEHIDFDPQQQQLTNSRLDRIYAMEQKYHVASEAELISLHADVHAKLSGIDHSDEQIAQQEQHVARLEAQCQAGARKLSDTRKAAAAKVEAEMVRRLQRLGIPNIRFKIAFEHKTLSHDGIDKVSFEFSANKNVDLQPVSKVASGGEIARVMLSLKALISEHASMPTVIFDEIDTGVSGRVAEEMARVMQDMGRGDRQVLSITHLPQIAACGDYHYKVVKRDQADATRISMIELNQQQRVQEIAQMLSGSNITEAAIDNARSLLDAHQKGN